jgi:hypothetical protein
MKKTARKTKRATSKKRSAPKKLGLLGSLWKKIRSM